MKIFIFIMVIGIINFYGFICHPEMKQALVLMDLMSFAMALAIIYVSGMSNESDE